MSDPISYIKSSGGDVDAAISDERSMKYVEQALLDGRTVDVNAFVKAASYEDWFQAGTFNGWAYPFTKEFVQHDRITHIHVRYNIAQICDVRVGIMDTEFHVIASATAAKTRSGVFDEYWYVPVLVSELPDVFYVFVYVNNNTTDDKLQLSGATIDSTYKKLSSKYDAYYRYENNTVWVKANGTIGNPDKIYRPVVGLFCVDNAVGSMLRPIPLVFSGDYAGWTIDPSGNWHLHPDYPNYQVCDPVPIEGYRRITVFTDWTKFNPYLLRIAFSTSDALPTASGQSAHVLARAIQTHAGPVTLDVPDGAKFMYVSSDTVASGDAPTTWPRAVEVVDGDFVADFLGTGSAGAGPAAVAVRLPEEYRLVVGDTFELFWKGVVAAFDPYARDILCQCDMGSCFARKFSVTPSDAGDHDLTVSVRDDAGNVLGEASTVLRVTSKASSPSSLKNVLCVGDSLTAPGVWPHELDRRLTGTGGTPVADGLSNVEFIGTQEHEGTAYEGYGGWTFDNYNSESKSVAYVWITCTHDKTAADQHSTYRDVNNAVWKIETIEASRLKMIRQSGSTSMPASGTLTHVSGGEHTGDIVFTASETAAGNPFWDEDEGRVDFASYAQRIGASGIDYCYVLMGWNSTLTSESAYKAQIRTFINNLRASYPSCVVVLMGIQVPSLDGFGTSYGCDWNYMDKLRRVHDFDQWYADVASEYSNVYTVSVAGQFDAEYGYPTSTVPVNVRSSKTEARQSNGVHPSDDGYMQIADAAYRDLTYRLKQ